MLETSTSLDAYSDATGGYWMSFQRFGKRMRQSILATCLILVGGLNEAAWAVDFNKEVKPVLEKFCYKCHGPSKQEGGLRLDSTSGIQKGGDGGKVVVPGDSSESNLYLFTASDDPSLRMPPKGSRPTKQQIAAIKKWIDDGAKLTPDKDASVPRVQSNHWAFQPVKRLDPPQVKQTNWPRNSIDHFILARLEAAGLRPSPEADRPTLIRRVSLDLLGLPPRWEEVQEFVNDTHPDAYERMVDRLLTSPHYGERWGRHWLDLARYADSNGFTIDGPRSIWKYRDWVIHAINRDLPFDQFTIEQLAGDMLPNATNDQLIATGFHRNTLINQEGGTDQEQFRVEAVVDRVSTTGAVFLGLTVGCAQCHTHKFDPITQREFYQLFAFFNNSDEPNLTLPTDEEAQQDQKIKAELAAAEKALKAHDAAAKDRQAAWENELAQQGSNAWKVLKPLAFQSAGGAEIERVDGDILMVGGEIPQRDTYTVTFAATEGKLTALRLEALTTEILPETGPGLAADGNFVLSELTLSVLPPADAAAQPVPFSQAVALYSASKYPIAHAVDGKPNTGWSIGVEIGKLNVDRSAHFILKKPLTLTPDSRLVVTLKHEHGMKHNLGRFRLSATDADVEKLKVPEEIRQLVQQAADKRDAEQQQLISAEFGRNDRSREVLANQVTQLKKDLQTLAKSIVSTMILRERKTPRETHVHIRGDFLRHGDLVQPEVLEVLPPLPKLDRPANRLDLAKWLVDPANPLPARVTMNRFWQRYFGTGLVETENDFGTQGSTPSHPELLDWLASEFIAQGWSMKAMHRLIVSSAVYRQSSNARTDLAEIDPRNKLLARQERLRLDAEIIRDSCLSVSGLLTREIGGPGVYPPQPAGVYRFTQNDKAWRDSQGENRYRRTMYTYFWRSSPHPFLTTFDCPNFNVTCTNRVRSNTPLQALTMANDRGLFEIIQGVARRTLKDAAAEDAARLDFIFQICLLRSPSAIERQRLLSFYLAQRSKFEAAPQLATEIASPKLFPDCSPTEAAAWTMTARVLCNLDEFITRE